MKVLAVLSLLFVAAIATPVQQQSARTIHFQQHQQKFALVPDANGQLHYVDLDTVNPEPEIRFVAEQDVIFRLFTASNPTIPQVIAFNNIPSLTSSNFNAANPTRIIIHGWNNDGDSDVNRLIRQAYAQRGSYNVITVDWGAGAQTINYIAARDRVNQVGPLVARFIDFLNLNGGLNYDNLSVIGHSLGAHASGIVGKNTARGVLHTVIGLDPALPLFSIDSVVDRISPTDARYVEIIHTNGGLLGFDLPIGQADFYPNGGRTQPGCGIDIVGNCAHGRAYEFFAESINNNRFTSTRCANFNEIQIGVCTPSGQQVTMGGEPSNFGQASGVYFLATAGSSPFALG